MSHSDLGRPADGTGQRRVVVRTLVLLIFFALVFIYPFVIQLVDLVQDRAGRGRRTRSRRSRTRSPLDAFAPARWTTDFPLWLGNSVLVTVVVTVGRVFLDSLAGYALARLRFRGRAALFAAHRRGDGRARASCC